MLVLVQQVILPEMRGRFRRWFTSLKPSYLPCTFNETFFVSLALGSASVPFELPTSSSLGSRPVLGSGRGQPDGLPEGVPLIFMVFLKICNYLHI